MIESEGGEGMIEWMNWTLRTTKERERESVTTPLLYNIKRERERERHRVNSKAIPLHQDIGYSLIIRRTNQSVWMVLSSNGGGRRNTNGTRVFRNEKAIHIPAAPSLSLSGSECVRLIWRLDRCNWFRLMWERLMSPIIEHVSEFLRHKETVRWRIARCLAAARH